MDGQPVLQGSGAFKGALCDVEVEVTREGFPRVIDQAELLAPVHPHPERRTAALAALAQVEVSDEELSPRYFEPVNPSRRRIALARVGERVGQRLRACEG